MRDSNRRPALLAILVAAMSGVVAAACTTAASPAPRPSSAAPPVVTPNPHLSDPASVDAVFLALGSAGLRLVANNADAGGPGEPVKRINATFAGWPLHLSQFSSAAALQAAAALDPPRAPGPGEAPFTLAGLNILVEFGPKRSEPPGVSTPDPTRRTAALALVDALAPLLGPLAHRSVEPLPLPSAPSVAVP